MLREAHDLILRKSRIMILDNRSMMFDGKISVLDQKTSLTNIYTSRNNGLINSERERHPRFYKFDQRKTNLHDSLFYNTGLTIFMIDPFDEIRNYWSELVMSCNLLMSMIKETSFYSTEESS